MLQPQMKSLKPPEINLFKVTSDQKKKKEQEHFREI